MNKREGFYLMKEEWPLPLEEEEIRELFQAYHAGNYDAKTKIFMHNMRFVPVIINSLFSFKLFDRRNYDLDDLIQVGFIGLYRAIDDFDLSLNYKFTSFAKSYIRNEISNYLKKLRKHYNECSLEEPDDKFLNQVNCYDSEFSREEVMPCLFDFTDDILDDMMLQEIKRSFSILNQQEMLVLSLYLGFSGSPLGYQKIGEMMGVSHTRVGNIYHKALQKLREENHI